MPPKDNTENDKSAGFSFQDLMADMGELPKAEETKAPIVPANRNRVEAGQDAPPRPGVPRQIFDRPRPVDAPIPKNAAIPAIGAKGQPKAIFFEDDSRKAILDEQDEATRKQELEDRINSGRVLGAYEPKPLWTTALLFAAITSVLLYFNLGSNDYRAMFDPWLSFGVIFFAGITALIGASGILSENTFFGKALCFAALAVGGIACYLVYPNVIG